MGRKERKAEEARILKELDEEVAAQRAKDAGTEKQGEGKSTPAAGKIYCRRCKSQMQDNVCPVCGYKIYTPMSEEKRKMTRLVVGGACVLCFVVIYLLSK